MIHKLYRSMRLAMRLYAGYERYLIISTLTGVLIYFSRPLISPVFLRQLFDCIAADDVSGLGRVAALAVGSLSVLVAAGYFLILYADAWAVYLVGSGCISSLQSLYDKPYARVLSAFAPEEQFTRITGGSDAPSSVATILVQCAAMALAVALLCGFLGSMSWMLLLAALVFLVLEFLGVRLQLGHSYARQRRVQEEGAVLNGEVETLVIRLEQLAFLDERDELMDEIAAAQQRYWKARAAGNRVQLAFQFYDDAIFAALRAASFGALGFTSGWTAGELGSVGSLLDSLRGASSTTMQFAAELPDYLARSDRLQELLDFAPADAAQTARESPDAIRLQNVTVTQGERTVLRDVSLAIRRGEKVALTGGNGSGKTTCLRVILGGQPVESGEVLLCGVPAGSLSPEQRQRLVGYVPVDCQLYHLPARENIAMDAPDGQPLFLPDGEDFWERRDLSAGQQKRVSLLRGIQKRPAVLLADEPDAELNPALAAQYLDLLLARADTVLAVTHNPALLPKFDRVLEIRDGKILDQSHQRANHVMDEPSPVDMV